MELSNMDAVLLGLLAEEDKHAYQVEKDIRDRSMREWTELSMSSVYKSLNSLEERGLIASRAAPSPKGIQKKVFTLTTAGRASLVAKIEALLREPEKMIWRVDIATYNVDLLPRKKLRAALDEYEKRLKEALACYKALEDYLRKEGCPNHRMALALRPQFLIQGELRWLKDYRKDLLG